MEPTAERIAEIRKRTEGASSGPWLVAQIPSKGNDVGKVGPYVYKEYWGAVAITPKDSPQYSNIGGNLPFIANAREDIPWLLDALDAAEKRLDIESTRLRQALQHIADGEHPDWCAQMGRIRDSLGWRRCWCCLAEKTLKETT